MVSISSWGMKAWFLAGGVVEQELNLYSGSQRS